MLPPQKVCTDDATSAALATIASATLNKAATIKDISAERIYA
jgi:hypothetical protein